MNRRDLIMASLRTAGAVFIPPALGGLVLEGCGGNSSTLNPTPSPPPCPAATHGTGLTFASSQRLGGIAVGAPPASSSTPNLPSYFDLADTNLMAQYGYGQLLPPIGNQGQQGSCVAWGVGYAVSTNISMFDGGAGAPPTSPQGVGSPADLYAKLLAYEKNSCGNGTLVADALDIAIVEGIASLAQVPYQDSVCAVPSQLRTFTVAGYNKLDPTNSVALKQYLSNGFVALPLAIVVYPALMQASGSDVFSLSGSPDCSLGGHCIVLTGWDDSRHAYRIMNSWGTSWGDSGYLWVDYETFTAMVQEAYAAYFVLTTDLNNGIDPSSVTSSGSIVVQQAQAIVQTSGTQASLVVTFTLSGPLQVTAVNASVSGQAMIAETLGQWALSLVVSAPLSSSQVSALTSEIQLSISGNDSTGQAATTSCNVRLGNGR
jgi:papain like protease